MSVHGFLVTFHYQDSKWSMWHKTGPYANWLEGRTGRNGETWHVMCFDEHAEAFLTAAREVGVTVEEIEHSDGSERYEMRVGEPGTGWEKGDAP